MLSNLIILLNLKVPKWGKEIKGNHTISEKKITSYWQKHGQKKIHSCLGAKRELNKGLKTF